MNKGTILNKSKMIDGLQGRINELVEKIRLEKEITAELRRDKYKKKPTTLHYGK